jgi:hypothetical protein
MQKNKYTKQGTNIRHPRKPNLSVQQTRKSQLKQRASSVAYIYIVGRGRGAKPWHPCKNTGQKESGMEKIWHIEEGREALASVCYHLSKRGWRITSRRMTHQRTHLVRIGLGQAFSPSRSPARSREDPSAASAAPAATTTAAEQMIRNPDLRHRMIHLHTP